LRVFVSCVFNASTEQMIKLVKEIFKMYKIEVFVSGEVEPKPLPESIKSHIKGSDAFFAIVTKEKSEWVQNEIGIAYSFDIPIYAIVEENLEIGGVLSHITIYGRFNLQNPMSIIQAISSVAERISETQTEGETAEIYRLFKNRREQLIYKIGANAAAHQIFLLLLLEDLSPAFYETYKDFHKNELDKLIEELKQIE